MTWQLDYTDFNIEISLVRLANHLSSITNRIPFSRGETRTQLQQAAP